MQTQRIDRTRADVVALRVLAGLERVQEQLAEVRCRAEVLYEALNEPRSEPVTHAR